MKTTEIKDFIDENTGGIYESIEGSIFDCPAFRRMHETLEKVKSMLSQLDNEKPKAHWIECGVTYCSNCKWQIEEYEELPNYCECCGAQMEADDE